MKFVLSLLFALTAMFFYAQEKNLTLQKSNDLVYEGNELVDENFVSAEKEYRKAISKAPSNAVGSYNLGNGLFNAGYYDEAMLRHLETVKNATSKKEKHKAFHNIGNVLMKQNLCKEAVEAYKNALRNDPTDDESRYNLALAKECAKQQGDGEGEDEGAEGADVSEVGGPEADSPRLSLHPLLLQGTQTGRTGRYQGQIHRHPPLPQPTAQGVPSVTPLQSQKATAQPTAPPTQG